jgi:hypothetical protein
MTEDRTDLIRKRAYEFYLRRGRSPGRELDDWLVAERDVESDLKQSPPPLRSEPVPAAQGFTSKVKRSFGRG